MYRIATSVLAGSCTVSAFHSTLRNTGSIVFHSSYNNNMLRFSKERTIAMSKGPSFCEKCGTAMEIKVPQGDERERHVCSNLTCGYVAYQNPKVVVGAICTYSDRVLLCKRAIEPCKGKWGYPQGYLEIGETTRQGAAREALEEAGVKFDPAKSELLALYNLAGIQLQTIYRVTLDNDEFKAGHESSEVRFVCWNDIPWDELAFPTVQWGLEHALAMRDESKPLVQERTKLVTVDGQWRVEEG
jgi:ADP-ribose pyrophosphatase YjhB (NUDIX family)